jgi:hypothetical protein
VAPAKGEFHLVSARGVRERFFMSDSAYALRFIIGKYQGGEYPLQDSGELVIGRSSDLDMVLIEDMVSRKHAKISLQPGQIYIADLGSTNGTFVNGEPVRRVSLTDGTRVTLGRTTLVFRRDRDEWRLVHRHADPLTRPIDPNLFAAIARGDHAAS